jgi:glutamate mutase epsilon subunit
MPARDIDGYLRILDPGLMPFPRDAMEIHETRLRQRAAREGVAFGHELAVSSVYEIAEPVATLLSDKWTS